MTAGPGSALGAPPAGPLHVARSAVVLGTARLGEGSLLAEGAVIRSHDLGVARTWIRYEDLVRDPATTMAQVAGALG